jgi:NADH:ubiquinone oxidoreductase subunit K
MLLVLGLLIVLVSVLCVAVHRGDLIRMMLYMELAFVGFVVVFASLAIAFDDVSALGVVVVLFVFGAAESAVALGLLGIMGAVQAVDALGSLQR